MTPSSLKYPPAFQQRGVSLVVSLIMLLLITMLATASFRLAKGNLQIVGNMQQRNQGGAAAQGAIDLVISSTQFTATPTNAIPNPCGGVANSTCVDVNGDGVTDVNVTVLPTCVAIQPILTSSLNLSNRNDQGCFMQSNQDFGVSGGTNNNSMCSNSVWDIQASAADAVTSAQYVVNEGVGVRVPSSTVCP